MPAFGESCRRRGHVFSSLDDPRPPSSASAWNGSYLGISCRQRRSCTTVEDDPNAKYSHIRWPVAMKDSGDVCLACARWAMLSRSNSLHDLSADLAAAVCVGVNIDVPAASLQVGGLGVG